MFCKNCGAQMNENEKFCSNCGATVTNSVAQPQAGAYQASPTQTPNVQPAMSQTPGVQPTMPQASGVQPAMAQPNVSNAGAGTNVTQSGGNNNKTIILVVVLVLVVLVGIGGGLFVFLGKDKSGTSSNQGDKTQEVSTNQAKENTVSYGGYTFTVPDGYTSQLDTEYGVVMNNGSIGFSIAVDYTNSFEAYKAAFAQTYPTLINDALATIGNRNYLVVVSPDAEGNMISEYVTEAGTGSVFVGVVLRSDATGATAAEYSALTNVLDSANNSSTNFAAGDNQDIGKNGVVDFISKGANISFNK